MIFQVSAMMNVKAYAPIVVRIGLSLVFLWFGINQIFNREDFLSYLPEFLLTLSFAETIVLINGIFEVIAGLLLLLGIGIRPVALLLAIHLLGITFSLGYNDIAIRDFGLVMATIAVFLYGTDRWSIEQKWKKDT